MQVVACTKLKIGPMKWQRNDTTQGVAEEFLELLVDECAIPVERIAVLIP
jgi:hypothetical protein